MLGKGATLGARWLHEPQPITNHPVGFGCPHPAGRYRPGGIHFRPRLVGVVAIWKSFRSGDWALSSPGAARP